ncbi:MAG: hypothetical protein CSA68_12085 [Rhodobacterales bacterium]|nr:MAG: hypothetical protein CSA68_12085 [Rhodobacterales bacterium]
MSVFRVFLVLMLLGSLSACSKFPTYHGPEVTRVVVYKERHQMYLLHHDTVLKSYRIALGFAPEGHKKFQGDGKTPEGDYIIDRRNPNSNFYLSIGISYPNTDDLAHAKAAGRDPGGDIFIHGGRRRGDPKRADWTAGCISVPDRHMRTIYSMVRNGTPITIHP